LKGLFKQPGIALGCRADIRLAEHAFDHRQGIGAGSDQQAAIFRGDAADGNDRNLQRAARRAQQRNGGGRVLSVDPEGAGYRVKVLKDGEVRIYQVIP